MNSLPVQRASQLSTAGPQTQWLVQELWADQAVGILGGEPKCCKSFLALDVAVSVASGAACLRQFPVRRTGKVLLFPAEDSLAVVRQRLEAIACAAQVGFASLAVEVITAPSLRLDTPTDRQRLRQTVRDLRPILLILDPLIRLHRVDENDATQVAALLSYLRELQRQFHLAILLVHHARKDSHSSRPGQALRGSSELHGWGDSNLYLRRKGSQLTLSTEHRAAPSQDHIPLQLTACGSALALSVLEHTVSEPSSELTSVQRVRQSLAPLQEPVSVQQLRKLCGMRMAAVCTALQQLSELGEVSRNQRGYQLNHPFPVSRPLHPKGNGNGKRSLLLSSETEAGSAEEQPAEG
jgi:biotin operon repressor